MEKKIVFIHFINRNGLFEYSSQIDLNLKKNLEDQGMQCITLYNEDVNNIRETVEEIADSDCCGAIFTWYPENHQLLCRISEELGETDDEIKVIWYQKELEREGILELGSMSVFVARDYQGIAAYLSGTSEDEFDPTMLQEQMRASNAAFTQQYKEAMTYGFTCFQSGIYPKLPTMYTKHIGIEEGCGLQKADCNELTNMNCAFIEQVDAFDEQRYEQNTLVPGSVMPHYHQMDGERCHFDNSSASEKYQKCSYSEFVKIRGSKQYQSDVTYFLSLQQKEDLESFKRDIELFGNTGTMVCTNFYLLDECRWTNQCSLKMLYRMNITGDLQIKPCQECSQTIGTVEDDYYTIVRNANRSSDQTIIKNKCMKCDSVNTCSKCAMLPDSVDREQYCQVIQAMPEVTEFLLKKNFLQYLLKNSNVFKGKKVNSIVASSQKRSLFFEENEQIIDLSKITYLFENEKQFYIFDFKRNNLIKIDAFLASVMEGYNRNYDEEKLTSFVVKYFHSSEQDAKEKVFGGIDLLKRNGMI